MERVVPCGEAFTDKGLQSQAAPSVAASLRTHKSS